MMKRLFACLIFCVISFSAPTASAFTMDVQGGVANAVSHITSFNVNAIAHFWYPIDQMVFFGIGSGYEELDNVAYVPVMASAWVRLPIGGQVLPVVTGDFGYAFGEEHQMIWRAGGGFDIKNGDYSSLLLMGGFQFLEHSGRGYVYLQAGILVEI